MPCLTCFTSAQKFALRLCPKDINLIRHKRDANIHGKVAERLLVLEMSR